MNLFEATHTRLVSIVTAVIPVGVAFRVVGAADGVEWTVDEGIGSGAVVTVSDPAAPLEGAVSYRVETSTGVESASLTRVFPAPWGVDTVLMAVDGRSRVEATWEGDAGMSWSPGLRFAQPIGHRWPVATSPLAPGGRAWDLEFRVDLDQVRVAQRVLDRGLVWVAHAASHCDGGSTIPPVMLAGVDGDVQEGRWPLGRTYQVTLRELDPEKSGVPVVMFGEAATVWGPGTTFQSIRAHVGGGV